MAHEKNARTESNAAKKSRTSTRKPKRSTKPTLDNNPTGVGMSPAEYRKAVKARGFVESTDGVRRSVERKPKRSTKPARNAKAEAKQRRETARNHDHAARNASHGYGDRVSIIADTLRHEFNGAATAAELFKVLRTGSTGPFATVRRINATWRQNVRHLSDGERPYDLAAGVFTLRTRKRTAKPAKRTSTRKARATA